MKNKKNLLWIIPVVVGLIILILGLLSGRINQMTFLKRRPDSQSNTTWVSEDGKICIHTNDEFVCKIYFEQSPGKEYYFSSGFDRLSGEFYRASVHYPYYAGMYSLEESKTLPVIEEFEEWTFTEYRKNSFTVVVERTTFLTVGETITFNKIQDNS